ncbi:MAG TPA: hypothetical protein VKZ65_05565 [Glycomyces sp.]|nr:hypothetical protein [Glycomyces sp.]
MRTNPSSATSAPSWAPPDACRLPDAEVPMRLAAFDDLFATAVTAVARPEATRLRLELTRDPGVAARAAELAVHESHCCGFFTFTLTATADGLVLDAAVPAARADVLDGLAARAAGGRP